MVPERKEKGAENLFEGIMDKRFPNLGKKTNIQMQEAQSPKQDESREIHMKVFRIEGKIVS